MQSLACEYRAFLTYRPAYRPDHGVKTSRRPVRGRLPIAGTDRFESGDLEVGRPQHVSKNCQAHVVCRIRVGYDEIEKLGITRVSAVPAIRLHLDDVTRLAVLDLLARDVRRLLRGGRDRPGPAL